MERGGIGRGGEQLGGCRCARRGLYVDAAPVRWPGREGALVRFMKMARPGSDAELFSLALFFTAPGDAAAPKTGAPGPGQTLVRVPNRPGPSCYGPRGGDASSRPAQAFLLPENPTPLPRPRLWEIRSPPPGDPGPSPPGPHIRPRAKVPQTGRFSFPAAARGTDGGPVVRPDSRRLRLRSLVLLRAPGSGAPGTRALEGRCSSAVPDLRSALPPATLARGLGRADRAAEAPRAPRSHGC